MTGTNEFEFDVSINIVYTPIYAKLIALSDKCNKINWCLLMAWNNRNNFGDVKRYYK
ncbi:hypothetical protein HYE31_02450 [Mycoplasmopsis bovis]|nr:hypothetical protein HYE31_02450 [Mycoplasmopsis bovis]